MIQPACASYIETFAEHIALSETSLIQIFCNLLAKISRIIDLTRSLSFSDGLLSWQLAAVVARRYWYCSLYGRDR